MATALSVARELVKLSASGPEPDPLTGLRLQKLLYYAQGWSLSIQGANLFAEPIQARRTGPAIRAVQGALPRGAEMASKKAFADAPPLKKEEAAFVNAVWEAYRPFSAGRLAEMMQAEVPWRDADSEKIDDRALADWFDRQMVPAPLLAHRERRERMRQQAREELAAMPPLNLGAFAAAARAVARRKPSPATSGKP